MAYEWYVALFGRTHGPLTREALLNILERDGTAKTLLWSPSLGRWTRVRDCDEVSLALAEREEVASRPSGGVPLTVLPPPPGEPWFYPVSSVAVALLNLVTLGLYAFVWRYQHRTWALRRAGRPTSPVGAVFRGAFRLDLELARAARKTGVYSPLGFDPRWTLREQGVLLALVLLVPPILAIMVIVVTISDAMQQETANRVNRAVAPRLRARLVGWPEIGTLLAVPVGFLGAFVGLVTWLLVS
jgi:GYF domain 2